MKWLKMRQVQFFTQALGGPAIYKGKDMKVAHDKMKIAAKEFDLTVGHPVETLKAAGVGKADIDTIVGASAVCEGHREQQVGMTQTRSRRRLQEVGWRSLRFRAARRARTERSFGKEVSAQLMSCGENAVAMRNQPALPTKNNTVKSRNTMTTCGQ
jgi:hypothetical protein